jgi:Flp pilus assembly protein TadD
MNSQLDGTDIRPPAAHGPNIPPRAAPFFAGAWPLAVLLLLATVPYVGILRNDFAYTYDDKVLILDSPYVHNFQHLRQVLTTTLWSNLGAQGGTPYYRPMATLDFLLCYQLFGPLAYGFHLVSLLLNAAAVGILFLLAEQILGDRVAAFAAAGLFALHPVHVEAVAWISAVTDIEVTLFYLLTFWCFLRVAAPGGRRRTWAEAAMTGSFVLAILSKEQALTLPLLAAIYEHFYRGDRLETTRLQKVLRYGPLWLVSLGYVLLRVRLMGSFAHTTGMHTINQPEMLLSAVALVGQYLGKLFWPARLSAFHPFHASTGFFDLPVLAGVCALAFSAWLFRTLGRRARPVSFGILWLFVTLAPVLNARWMSAYVFAERYLYLPSVGFCLVAGWACAVLWQTASSRRSTLRTTLVAAACVVAALCVLRISLRVLDWRDDVTLFTRTLAAQPNDYRLHDALGLAYWIRGESEGAEREWRETLRLEPNSLQTLDSLGALYAQQHRFDQALPPLGRALRLNPNDANAHLNLGAAYAETGKLDRAEEHFRAAVLLSPMNFNAHNLLGKLYYDSKRLAAAEQQFRQSLQCEPNLAAYDHLGYIYAQWGDRDRAEKAFKAALAMNSTDSHAHFNLGLIYAATGRSAQAVEELQTALAADPKNPEILSALEKLKR